MGPLLLATIGDILLSLVYNLGRCTVEMPFFKSALSDQKSITATEGPHICDFHLAFQSSLGINM